MDNYKDIKNVGLKNDEETSKMTSINICPDTKFQEQSWAECIQTYLNMGEELLYERSLTMAVAEPASCGSL